VGVAAAGGSAAGAGGVVAPSLLARLLFGSEMNASGGLVGTRKLARCHPVSVAEFSEFLAVTGQFCAPVSVRTIFNSRNTI
jgi:hypothetical protein